MDKGSCGLALQLQQPLHFAICSRLLGPEFQQGSRTQNLGSTAGILLARQLQHQLVIANGLQGGFRYPQTIDAPIEHFLDRFQLFLLHLFDDPTGHHLEGELAAPLKIQPQRWRKVQN